MKKKQQTLAVRFSVTSAEKFVEWQIGGATIKEFRKFLVSKNLKTVPVNIAWQFDKFQWF